MMVMMPFIIVGLGCWWCLSAARSHLVRLGGKGGQQDLQRVGRANNDLAHGGQDGV